MEIARYHKEWIVLATKLGGGMWAEDLVQDAYIKILDYKKQSKALMFYTLRSVVLNNNRTKKVEYSYECLDHFPEEVEKTLDDLCQQIDAELQEWHWFDRKLFELYRDSGMTYRDIAKETTISLTSIWKTLKVGKNIIKDKFKNDYYG